MSFQGFDCAFNTTPFLARYKAAGISEVMRYNTPGGWVGKAITSAEAQAIKATGLALTIIYEAWGGTHNELNAGLGQAHANFSQAFMAQVGAPNGAAIYYAIDTDPTFAQINAMILPYFRAIRAAHGGSNGKFKVGAYAPGAVLLALKHENLIDFEFLPNAIGWSGYRACLARNTWDILQSLPQKIAGIGYDVDPHTFNRPHGAFYPWGTLVAAADVPLPLNPNAPTPQRVLRLNDSGEDVLAMQKALNAHPVLIDEDGDFGIDTRAMLMRFQKAHQLDADGACGDETRKKLGL